MSQIISTLKGDISNKDFGCKEGQHDQKEGERSDKKRKSRWGDFAINLIGEKADVQIHFCDGCDLPIKIYGRIIPCTHAFCYSCAHLYDRHGNKMCPSCGIPVLRIEKHTQGSVFMCTAIQGCKRTHLSQGNLDAHISHYHRGTRRHIPFENFNPYFNSSKVKVPGMWQDKGRGNHASVEKPATTFSTPVYPRPFRSYQQRRQRGHAASAQFSSKSWVRQETVGASARKSSNLIVVPIQQGSNSADE